MGGTLQGPAAMVAHAVPLSWPRLDRINRSAYGQRGALRMFGSATGWLDEGERVAVELVAGTARGAPILDIGIGGGRTTPLMLAISDDYCGIDYAPAMVALAQRRFPGTRFLLMDARQLDFADAGFRLATFSYIGIDSVDLAGQHAILREVYRVLASGGYFVFSALNVDAAAQQGHWPDWTVFHGAATDPLRLARGLARFAIGGINRLRRSLVTFGDNEAAIGPLSACNFSLLSVFASLAGQVRWLRAAGFAVEAIVTPQGQVLAAGDTRHSAAPWHHFVARKGEAAGLANTESP